MTTATHTTPTARRVADAGGAIEESRYCRLLGTSGAHAAIGQAVKLENDSVCWKLHPVYAQWLWPLMSRVAELVLLVPQDLLEPLTTHDIPPAPRPPSEKEKHLILKIPERPTDCVRVYTLRVPGKAALVHRAFPTRLANLLILRDHRRGDQATAARKANEANALPPDTGAAD